MWKSFVCDSAWKHAYVRMVKWEILIGLLLVLDAEFISGCCGAKLSKSVEICKRCYKKFTATFYGPQCS